VLNVRPKIPSYSPGKYFFPNFLEKISPARIELLQSQLKRLFPNKTLIGSIILEPKTIQNNIMRQENVNIFYHTTKTKIKHNEVGKIINWSLK